MPSYTKSFSDITANDLAQVGGNNASLGELYQRLILREVRVPNGFATIAEAYWHFLEENRLDIALAELLCQLDIQQSTNLVSISRFVLRS